MRLMHFAISGVVGAALVLAACGDDDPPGADATQPGSDGPAMSGAVVPNTFMTVDGERYRLVEVLQADLLDSEAFEPVGTATALDVEAKDRTVYQREGDEEHLYTFAEGSGSGEKSVTATWLRWRRDS